MGKKNKGKKPARFDSSPAASASSHSHNNNDSNDIQLVQLAQFSKVLTLTDPWSQSQFKVVPFDQGELFFLQLALLPQD